MRLNQNMVGVFHSRRTENWFTALKLVFLSKLDIIKYFNVTYGPLRLYISATSDRRPGNYLIDFVPTERFEIGRGI